jgi:surfactin synthase thioesterase subunit
MKKKTNKKIFISGSKSISKLTDEMFAVLDKVMQDGDTILVGDCYGADFAVQKYLLQKGYTDVIVYCSGEQPRKHVVGTVHSCAKEAAGLKGKAFQYVKDAAMCDDCDEAYGFWDCQSLGTLENAKRVQVQGKWFHYICLPDN